MCMYVCRRSLQREEPDLGSGATHEAFAPSSSTSSCSNSMLGPGTTSAPVPAHTSCSHDNAPVAASHRTPPVLSPSEHSVQRAKSLEGVFPGTPQMSAALPRGFRRSEGTSRLSAVVTPRPFSTKTSRRSTQPRFYSVRAVWLFYVFLLYVFCFPTFQIYVFYYYFFF